MDEKDLIPYEGTYPQEGSVEYLERYEYIESRSQKWLDNFMDSVEFDFTRANIWTKAAQEKLGNAYEAFAKGYLTPQDVGEIAKEFRETLRRKVDLTPPEILAKRPKKNFPGYHPFFWTQIAYLREAEKRFFFVGKRRPKDVISVCVDGGEGFAADGSPMDINEAQRLIYEELNAKHFGTIQKYHIEYKEIDLDESLPNSNEPPPEYRPEYPRRPPPVKKKSIDELREEYLQEQRRKSSLTRTEKAAEKDRLKYGKK